MKNFVKIFMTVVAGMIAFSCATDTTDDLGVNLGKGQKTVISVSLEESRTQLGGYDEANEKYPMYWSAEDKISANGIVSEKAVINTGNAAVASFAVNGLGEPNHYFITYPAVANDWQVKFAAEQKWTTDNDTFDEGVSTMYGYSEEGLNVQMNHLTGILKIGIVLPEGSAAKELIKAQISTVDRKPIAGTFDFAFETDAEGNKVPKLTPTADAVSVIEYIFGNGTFAEGEWQGSSTPLSTNPTYIHVAVPAGTYDELYVTLYDNANGVMYATVKADDNKPLKAGKVREFTNTIGYTPADVYIVKDAETLAGVKDNLTKKVVMVADVDMTNEDWTSIEDFAGSFYGNGYAIKGLKAPLFGTTTASVIKGVHLENVNIHSSKCSCAALACLMTNEAAVVEHCSATGTITIDGGNGGQADDNLYYTGVIAKSSSKQSISDIYSNVKLTLNGQFDKPVCACGVVATFPGTLLNITNHGTVTFNGTMNAVSLYASGIADTINNGMQNCINGIADGDGTAGSVTISDSAVFTTANLVTSGIAHKVAVTVSNCHNYGNVTVGKCERAMSIHSGVIRWVHVTATTVTNVTNHGTLTISGTSSNDTFCGGIFAAVSTKDLTCTNCYNYGDIIFDKDYNYTSTKKILYIGGLMGSKHNESNATFTTCENHGAITVDGEFSYGFSVGGLLGNSGGDAAAQTTTTFDNCHNYGAITLDENCLLSFSNIGGLVGRCIDAGTTTLKSCDNKQSGAITLNGKTKSGADFALGGIVGILRGPAAMKISGVGCTNSAPINVGGTTAGETRIGGIFGICELLPSIVGTPSLVNTGTITCSTNCTHNTAYAALAVGGIVGVLKTSWSGSACKFYNGGDISCTTAEDDDTFIHVGGIVGTASNIYVGNARCFCYVNAPYATYAGMIFGKNISNTTSGNVRSCYLGGWIKRKDTDGAQIKLTLSNYPRYIYGQDEWNDGAVKIVKTGGLTHNRFITSLYDEYPQYEE